jgi:phosphatidylserine decarboxylase
MRWQTLYEGRWVFAALAVAVAGAWWLHPWAAVLPAALFVFSIAFFRDPDRPDPGEAGAVVAPADGKVVAIETVREREVTGTDMVRISIFLSVFDVHTNRMPLAGRVLRTEEAKGEYLDARDPRSSERNACRTWAFACGCGTVVVRQITGAVARRIVAWARPGEELGRGERFGMIRFGSRTELYLPVGCEICVEVGESVRGGATVVARVAGGEVA